MATPFWAPANLTRANLHAGQTYTAILFNAQTHETISWPEAGTATDSDTGGIDVRRWSIVAILCLASNSIFCSPCCAKGTNWIGPPRDEVNAGRNQFHFVKTFTLDRRPSSALLRIGTDFAKASVKVNGNDVTTATPYDLPMPIDVSRWCERGDNQLSVQLQCDGGPAAFAFELECDKEMHIYSDESWVRAAQKPVNTFGRADQEHWWSLRTRPSVSDFDEYNQWKQAKSEAHTASLQLNPKFSVSEVFRVPKKLGSWISMAQDDRGRLIFGCEKSGLFRVTLSNEAELPKIEPLSEQPMLASVPMEGCHGLLWSQGQLFINASNSKRLYRLEDTDGDGKFDEVHQLREIPGGGGDHGRNDLAVGPNGDIYSIHGDGVDLPDGYSSTVPTTLEFAKSKRPAGGHLIRTDRDGSKWEVYSSGLRNPYGIAFNRDGEPFTYDADSERHVGLPWYRPTRMNHLLPHTDYGWRNRDGALPWPIYFPEILPPNVQIGRGSPTCVQFAYESNFPKPFDETLFAPDWAFGRIFAVHIVPRGASYSMHPETFMRGTPLNVCDIEFDVDGSMLLLTGGYGTQSVIYRVSKLDNGQVEKREANNKSTQQQDRESYSAEMRNLRRQIEQSDSLEFIWNHLDHPDRWIAHTARTSLERQPTVKWEKRVWSDDNIDLSLRGLLALTRVSPNLDGSRAWRKLTKLDLKTLSSELQLCAIRTAQLLGEYHRDSSHPRPIPNFEALFPTSSRASDRELCSLLSEHKAHAVVSKTLQVAAETTNQNDLLHYLMVLAKTDVGWHNANREAYFRSLEGAKFFKGDEGLPRMIQELTDEALSHVPAKDRKRFAAMVRDNDLEAEDEPLEKRPFVKTWTLDDFKTNSDLSGADAEMGRRIYKAAQCAHCHRFGSLGRPIGPDLTGIRNRYRVGEVLESILHPSKQISSRYTNHIVVTKNGQMHTGQVVWNGFRKSLVRIAPDPRRLDKTIEISKNDIQSQQPSPISPMPEGLLNTFSNEEILGLLKFLCR